MSKIGRPVKQDEEKHPLHGHFNGDMPWLDGCNENNRQTCLDCPAENPRLHKGGRPKRT